MRARCDITLLVRARRQMFKLDIRRDSSCDLNVKERKVLNLLRLSCASLRPLPSSAPLPPRAEENPMDAFAPLAEPFPADQVPRDAEGGSTSQNNGASCVIA